MPFDQAVVGPEVLHVVDRAVVEPAAGEVRVRIEAFAVNPLDLMVRSGQAPFPVPPAPARLARSAVVAAMNEAKQAGNAEIVPGHLILGLLGVEGLRGGHR